MSEKVMKAIKLVVEWRKMKDLCEERSDCIGCPYHENKACDCISTETMLRAVSDTFYEFIGVE